MKWTEIIRDSAWVVDNIISKSECEYFIQKAMDLGIQTKQSAGDIRHRNSTTVVIDDKKMAEKVYDRIKNYIPQEVFVDEDCSNLGLQHSKKDLYGRWTPYGLNCRWRVVRYPGRGHFGPHRDGSHVVDEHHRSLITINGFLTDRPIGFGGATRFVKDDIDVYENAEGIFTTPDCDVLYRVEADKAGKASVFFHDLMHDGEPLKKGSPDKWLFRTEIMYRRDKDSAPVMSSEETEAREYLKKAESAEKSADFVQATKYYKMAYRLDPTLDAGH